MKEDRMTVSVVTVCYNAAETIERTICSVISQTFKSIDYIIIDGGSTDGTNDVIHNYHSNLSYYVSEPDRGIYDAMNKGIDASKGEYVIFLNAGDVFSHSKVIEELYDRIQSEGSMSDLIYGDVIYQYSFGERYVSSKDLGRIKYDMVFSHQSVFVRSEILKKRHFDLRYRLAADYDFLLWAYLNKRSFRYIDIPVSVVDASGGATYGHFVKSRKESYIIQCSYGGNRILCYCWYLWKISYFKLTSTIKDIFPRDLLRLLISKKHAGK